MEPSPNPIRNYLSYALAAAHRKVTLSLNTRLKKHGMQIEAWRILETLETGQRLTMGQLADVVLMNPPTLTKLVDRMVSDGLVHRQVARHDHRQINVLATALGRKRMLQIRQEVEGQDAALLQSLGKPATEELIELLKGITQAAQPSSFDGNASHPQ
ncbi:MAG: MarR family winged helix-turn-helix transcriptional regulator [Boseongicola sp.]|nr:MarR family winged helix-turn-helix transcriptional regulator [Boseongicola sp.]